MTKEMNQLEQLLADAETAKRLFNSNAKDAITYGKVIADLDVAIRRTYHAIRQLENIENQTL